MDRKGGTDWGSSVAILVDWTSILALGRQPVGLARRATYFHLLAQMKVGKAKCPNASDPIELHGKKVRLMTSGSVQPLARPSQKTREKRERLDATGQHLDPTATPSCRSFGLGSLAFRHFALPPFICASK